jgi:outer membrane immunogenic protein
MRLAEGEMRFWIKGLLAAALLLAGSGTGAWAQSLLSVLGGNDAWSGAYFGGNLGLAFDASSYTVSPGGCIAAGTCANAANNSLRTFSSTFNGTGFTGGGQVGYNWRVGPAFLLGAEADIDYDGLRSNQSATASLPAPLAGTNTRSISLSRDFLGTVRGRLGFIPSSSWLVYATGGLAYGQTNSATSTTFSSVGDSYAGSISGFKTGWTAGGGLEWAITPFWSVKAEYLYVDLGSTTYTNAITDAAAVGAAGLKPQPSYQTRVSNDEHVVRIGVNYHFGAPPPPPPPPVVGVVAPVPEAPKVFIVYFDWDKDAITPEGAQVIQQAADAYKAGSPVQLQVTGYTDRSGSPGYNQRLSERRADNVAKALAALGVPKEQMAVTGKGENDNRVPTANGVREPQNRRVEIVAP